MDRVSYEITSEQKFMVDNIGKILHKNMNVVFLYALLVVGACFWHANCYEIDEETKMIF